MKVYNGYTPAERTKAGNYQRKCLSEGQFINPDRCDICNISHKETGKKIDRHNENYTDMMAFFPLCQVCHSRLHKRFENWENWKAAVIKGYSPHFNAPKEEDLSAYGNKWFHSLRSYEEPEKRKEYEDISSMNEARTVSRLNKINREHHESEKTSSQTTAIAPGKSGMNNTSVQDYSWERFQEITEQARKNSTVGKSPNGKVIYAVNEVQGSKILFTRSNKDQLAQGKTGYEFFMKHFDKTNDCKYPVAEYNGNSDSKDKMYFIVAFHPALSWSDDFRYIVKS